MFGRIKLSTCVGLVCVLLSVEGTQAQESATVQAIATVLPALTVTGTNDLDFGTVIPGTPSTVDKADVGDAGELVVAGSPTAEVEIDFTLPDSLRTAGGEAMEVSFLATDASYDDGSGGGQATPSGVLNPLVTETQNLGAGGGMTIWIGGQVDPSPAQTGGSYTGTITLTITPTGN